MALLREPKGKDIIIESRELTGEEEKSISAFIKAYKQRAAKEKVASSRGKKELTGKS